MARGIKLIVLIIVASALSLTALAGGNPQFKAVSRFDSVGSAYTPEGKVKIEIREVHTEAAEAKEPRQLSVLVLFESESGAFSWRVTDTDATNTSWNTLQFKDGQAAFLKEGEIVDFRTLWGPPRLFVRAYRGYASSMDDAEAKALKAASASIKPREFLEDGQDVHVVSLLALGHDFVAPPMSEVDGPDPKVINVQWDRDKQHWIVTLQARWTEEITLDADYNLVSMKKVE